MRWQSKCMAPLSDETRAMIAQTGKLEEIERKRKRRAWIRSLPLVGRRIGRWLYLRNIRRYWVEWEKYAKAE